MSNYERSSDSDVEEPVDFAPSAGSRRSTLLADAVAKWTQQLVDITGRNTLLYYKDLKVGTLDLSSPTDIDQDELASLLAGNPTRLSGLFASPIAVGPNAKRVRTIAAKAKENFEERGLQTLLIAWGMATWSNQRSASSPAAPIFLCELTAQARTGAGEDFILTRSGDWEINPTFVHYLANEFETFIDTEAFEESMNTSSSDPSVLFSRIAAIASDVLKDFTITPRIVVGNFSYAKLPMVQDLKEALDSGILEQHDLIAAIAGDVDARTAIKDRHVVADIREPDFIPPEEEFLVLDADASQSYVINAAVKGADLVVEGPPGTGKSQTIANLIATLTARGKRVLFVAEKRAAIEAVSSRLEGVGLGGLILDLHGGASSKKALAQDLAQTLQRHATMIQPALEEQHRQLLHARETLVQRDEALHRPRDPWGCSVFELQAEIIGLPDSARTTLKFPPTTLAETGTQQLLAIEDEIRDFFEQDGPSLVQDQDPWSQAFSAATIRTPEQAQAALHAVNDLRFTALPSAQQRLNQVVAESGLRPASTIEEWATVLALLDETQRFFARFSPELFDLDLEAFATALAPAEKGFLGQAWSLLFNGTYRSARKSIAAVSATKVSAKELKKGVLDAIELGQRWAGVSADGGRPRLAPSLNDAETSFEELNLGLRAFGAYVGSVAVESVPFTAKQMELDSLIDAQTTLYRLPAVRGLYETLSRKGFSELVLQLSSAGADADQAVATVRHMWLTAILERISFTDNAIGTFKGTKHSRVAKDFIESEHAHIQTGAQRVDRAVAEAALAARNASPEESAVIERQARLKTRHMPVRRLFQSAPNVLGAIKPCWAMSPLVVSQLLPLERLFDVVIFDEASQVTPSGAIGALLRADRAIVAGDTKQLPPTSFFDAAGSETEASELDDDELDRALTSNLESILDVLGALLPPPYGTRTLGWHYRSRDEKLISFSNAQRSLYDWSLTTFPGTIGDDAIRHEHVQWTASGPGQRESSSAEVERVVELILEHAQERPHESLGVIAMGIKHANRIEETLRRKRSDDVALSTWLETGPQTAGKPEPFFIKNLERVQGDERDAIILTVGYGKGDDGRMVYRFGPLNMEGGERRLNVAITRARQRMTVVSSFSSADLDPQKLRKEGAQMLGRYLAYAESGGTHLGNAARDKPDLNPFERDVRDRLTEAGVPLIAQYGESGYWIDYAAQHPERPGEMVLAIECDGATYHSSHTARDRDRLRQEHLERLGWTFHRIWSTDWFNNREQEIVRATDAFLDAVVASDERYTANFWNRLEHPTVEQVESRATPSSVSRAPTRQAHLRPNIYPGVAITEYSQRDLVNLIKWIQSDTKLRTDDELIAEAALELGYKRRGSRIVDALKNAIQRTRS